MREREKKADKNATFAFPSNFFLPSFFSLFYQSQQRVITYTNQKTSNIQNTMNSVLVLVPFLITLTHLINAVNRISPVQEVISQIPFMHNKASPVVHGYDMDDDELYIEKSSYDGFYATAVARSLGQKHDIASVVYYKKTQDKETGDKKYILMDYQHLPPRDYLMDHLESNHDQRGIMLLIDGSKSASGIFTILQTLESKERPKELWSVTIVSASGAVSEGDEAKEVVNEIMLARERAILKRSGIEIKVWAGYYYNKNPSAVVEHFKGQPASHTAWITHVLLSIPEVSIEHVYDALKALINHWGLAILMWRTNVIVRWRGGLAGEYLIRIRP